MTHFKLAMGAVAMLTLLIVFATQRIPVPEKIIEVPSNKFDDAINATTQSGNEYAVLKKADLERPPKIVQTERVIVPEETPTPPPKERRHNHSEGKDVCARHNMRKVTYGRTWRCRKK